MMRLKNKKQYLIGLLFLVLHFISAVSIGQGQELIVNGSFENGSGSTNIPYNGMSQPDMNHVNSWYNFGHSSDWYTISTSSSNNSRGQYDASGASNGEATGTYITNAPDGINYAGFGACEGIRTIVNHPRYNCRFKLSFWYSPRAAQRDAGINIYLTSGVPTQIDQYCSDGIPASEYSYHEYVSVNSQIGGAKIPGNWYYYETIIEIESSEFNQLVIKGINEDAYYGNNTLHSSNVYMYIDDISLISMDSPYTDNTRYIENQLFNSEVTIDACKAIYAGYDVDPMSTNGNVVVFTTADLNFIAGEQVNLLPGFETLSGALFYAGIDPACICPDDFTVADAGSDIVFCRDQRTGSIAPYQGGNTIGATCAGSGSVLWTSNPSSALSWLANPNACQTIVTPPNGSSLQGVTYTLYVENSTGGYATDQVVVSLINCIDGLPTKSSVAVEDNPELHEESTFNIYPNPTTDLFNVELDNFTDNTSIEVINMMGKVIYSETVDRNKMSFDLSNESKGIYLVKITSDGETKMAKVVYQ